MMKLLLATIGITILGTAAFAQQDYFACMHDMERAIADCRRNAARDRGPDSYCDGLRKSYGENCERIRKGWAR